MLDCRVKIRLEIGNLSEWNGLTAVGLHKLPHS